MATQEALDQAQQLYVAYYGRPADQAGLQFWASKIDEEGLDAVINDFGTSAEFEARFGDLSNEELVENLYQQMFGRAADAEGLAFYTERLNDGRLTLPEIAATIAGGAQNDDVAVLGNKVAAANLYTEAAGDAHSGTDADNYAADWLASIDGDTDVEELDIAAVVAGIPEPTDPEEPSVPGDTFMLTPDSDRADMGHDNAIGTENDDTFLAPLMSINGLSANSLNTGDYLDGNGGNNKLVAEVQSGGAVSGESGASLRPVTQNIQDFEFTALNAGGGMTLGSVFEQIFTSDLLGEDFEEFELQGPAVGIDAARMTDVVNMGSYDSNASLVIYDVTTKTSNGGVRNTEELTFRMDHTANDNSNGFASNLTVYFDENYLLAGRVEDASRIQYEVMNQDAWDLINVEGRDDVELLDGVFFQRLSFTLNGELVDLHPLLGETGIEGDGLTIRDHEALAEAINIALGELGLADQVTASVGPNFVERSGVDTAEGRDAPTVVLEGQPGVELGANENFAFLAASDNSPIRNSNRYDRADEAVIEGEDERITTNVELHKVGRGAEGGDVHVGGKAGGSIAVFNVDVLGADEKPSNIGWLNTGRNQDGMETVNIATHEDYVDGESFASLTIRNGFDNNQGLIDEVNANDFLGDLTVGSGTVNVEGPGLITDNYSITLSEATFIENVRDFTATGGGDVEYWSQVGDEDGLASQGDLDYSITTGSGDDSIVTLVRGGAQLELDSGAGNDTIAVDLDGTTDSDSSTSSADITSMGGDNFITVGHLGDDDGEVYSATVTTGSGDDVVNGNNISLTASTGSGDDVIYAENTGDKTVATIAEGESTLGSVGNGLGIDATQLLFGRQVQVTVAMPGGTGTDNAAEGFENGFEVFADIESDGPLTSEADLYDAIARAINEDPIVSKLATASIDSNGRLTVQYLVDGASSSDENIIEYNIVESDNAWADLNGSQQNNIVSALQEFFGDSTIDAGAAQDAYNGVTTDGQYITVDEGGTNSASNGGSNVVNAGTGDDLIVLSSDDDTTDTVVFDAGSFGTNTIVHFNDGEDGDVLDFTAWLTNQTEGSGSTSTVSRDDVPTTFVDGNDFTANSVNLVEFSTLASGSTAIDEWADLTNESAVLNALNDQASVSDTSGLVGNDAFSIMMVENPDNAGEYKVFQVVSDNDEDFTSADLIGILDFGETQDFSVDNFA